MKLILFSSPEKKIVQYIHQYDLKKKCKSGSYIIVM